MNELIIKTIMKPVTPAIVLPRVHDFNVCVMVNPEKRETTQKPESLGNDRHSPPSVIEMAVKTGETSV